MSPLRVSGVGASAVRCLVQRDLGRIGMDRGARLAGRVVDRPARRSEAELPTIGAG